MCYEPARLETPQAVSSTTGTARVRQALQVRQPRQQVSRSKRELLRNCAWEDAAGQPVIPTERARPAKVFSSRRSFASLPQFAATCVAGRQSRCIGPAAFSLAHLDRTAREQKFDTTHRQQ